MARARFIGEIVELFLTEKESNKHSCKKTLSLDKSGVINDKYYGKRSDRTILMTSTGSYDLLQENGIKTTYGELGENIIVKTDFDIYSLEIGSKLSIGDLELEVTLFPTVCKHLSSIDKRAPKLLRNHRGIFVKALEEGDITIGDKVYLMGV